MEILFLYIWIISMVVSAGLMILSFIAKDKEMVEMSSCFFIAMILTGYLTFIPIVCAITLIGIKIKMDQWPTKK